MARLDGAGIEVDAEVRNREAVLAVGGKVVPELHPAARAEREAVDVERLVASFRLRVGGARDLAGFAHGQPRREPRGGDVLIEERGRDAQRRGDVVEAVDFDLGRQQLLGVELDRQQIVDGGPELRARQALHRHVAGHGPAGGARRASPPSTSRTRRSRADRAGGCRAAASAGRAACAARLPRRRRSRCTASRFTRVERHAAGLGPRVVAADAVGVERLARLLGAGALRPHLSEHRGRHGGNGDADAEGPLHECGRPDDSATIAFTTRLPLGSIAELIGTNSVVSSRRASTLLATSARIIHTAEPTSLHSRPSHPS